MSDISRSRLGGYGTKNLFLPRGMADKSVEPSTVSWLEAWRYENTTYSHRLRYHRQQQLQRIRRGKLPGCRRSDRFAGPAKQQRRRRRRLPDDHARRNGQHGYNWRRHQHRRYGQWQWDCACRGWQCHDHSCWGGKSPRQRHRDELSEHRWLRQQHFALNAAGPVLTTGFNQAAMKIVDLG
jgi:hypothetical protein